MFTNCPTAIVLAGGYGYFTSEDGPRPKILADIGGEPMAKRVVRLVRSAGFEQIVVVVNEKYDAQIRQTLEDDSLLYAVQPHRVGTAGAVKLALEQTGVETTDFLVTFADMPCWSSQTFQKLHTLHQERRPRLSLVTIPLVSGTRPERYGRVLRDANGRITGVIEPWQLNGKPISATTVNPSLYMVNTRFFWSRYDQLPIWDKGDGHPPERPLQALVPLADPIVEMRLDQIDEALGVNTADELHEVRTLLEKKPAAA